MTFECLRRPVPFFQEAAKRRRPIPAIFRGVALIGSLSLLTGALLADPGPGRKSSSAANAGARIVREPEEQESTQSRDISPRNQAPDPERQLDDAAADSQPASLADGFHPGQLVEPESLNSTLGVVLLMTAVSVVPSVLIMTTCFVRFAIVLGLLRQALGTPNLPPNQVLMGLCLFLTVLVMSPVWQESYDEGIRPYTAPEPDEPALSPAEAFDKSVTPVRRFMIQQMERYDNTDTIWMLLDHQKANVEARGGVYIEPKDYEQVPLATLVSSFLLSELKTAFVIGFQIYLPFLVIDLVVATVLTGMGMMMLPPMLVSFPFKLLLFVLIDGWTLTVGMLLESVGPFG